MCVTSRASIYNTLNLNILISYKSCTVFKFSSSGYCTFKSISHQAEGLEGNWVSVKAIRYRAGKPNHWGEIRIIDFASVLHTTGVRLAWNYMCMMKESKICDWHVEESTIMFARIQVQYRKRNEACSPHLQLCRDAPSPCWGFWEKWGERAGGGYQHTLGIKIAKAWQIPELKKVSALQILLRRVRDVPQVLERSEEFRGAGCTWSFIWALIVTVELLVSEITLLFYSG